MTQAFPKNRFRLRLIPLLLCLMLLLPAAVSAAKTTGTSDIRVNLRRLNLADQAWLTLEGRYLVR